MILLTQLFQLSELFQNFRFQNSRINKHLRLRKFRNFILHDQFKMNQSTTVQLFKKNMDKGK